MTRILTIFAFQSLLLLPSLSEQETKVTISEKGTSKVISCTNGGSLQLSGNVWVQDAFAPCADSTCKEVAHEKIVTGAHVLPGSQLLLYCTTKAEDDQSARDAESCKNNVPNPQPRSEAEMDKWRAEYSQCLKDRADFRRQKEHRTLRGSVDHRSYSPEPQQASKSA